MIQEKDFLYRVPVKTAPITTPGGQIRNPEILVDIEGGEFMHGNILDANSTNKLVNQSVKDAIDKNIADSGFVTKDLLDKEVDRATSAESDLQAAIDTKADAIALSNYVLTTALNQQVDTLNTAISAKQDAGNYIPYDSTNTSKYKIDKDIGFENEQGYTQIGFGSIFYSDTEGINRFLINPQSITFACNLGQVNISPSSISLRRDDNEIVNINHSYFSNKYFDISGNYIKIGESSNRVVEIDNRGIKFNGATENLIPKATGGFININDYALKTELPTVPTNVSQLTNDSNFIAATTTTTKTYEIDRGISLINGYLKTGDTSSINGGASLGANNLQFKSKDNLITYSSNGIYSRQHPNCIITTDNTFRSITDFAEHDFVTAGLSAKQNKIQVNTIDITDIETADVTKLRTIVNDLITALISSGLINATSGVE